MNLFIRIALFSCYISAFAQETQPMPSDIKKEEQAPAPAKIEIKPTARDEEIQERLLAILDATGWFVNPQLEVKEGVVFLSGKAKREEYKKWATELSRNTQDVSAVVNKIEIIPPSIWDFHPTLTGLSALWRDLLRLLPFLLFSIFILFFTWLIAKGVMKFARKLIKQKVTSPLLQEMIARGIGFFILLLGLYIVFRMMGLTTVALTILGGTGVLGVILGIAFRDITENLLSSVFLSIHQPFHNGDLVQIEGFTGYVERLTIRSTVLISLDGNHIQIPNATVYKTNIRNFSINPNRMEIFSIVIGYNEDVQKAQEIALKVLEEHPAVLRDPEPLILVDDLEKATVNLKVYFWLNGIEHSWLKVRSSVIRLVKRAFQNENISMPGEVHEMQFSNELPVKMVKPEDEKPPQKQQAKEPELVVTDSEAGLRSESTEIKEQAKQSRTPGKGEENLLNQNNTQENLISNEE
ncbi:MAG: mechanosensitive ion channel family protein [Simkaniaceae bacterium]|nr:mechanosensitive ion channel family protein [Candidatus Sacchlamyda saccharinae]